MHKLIKIRLPENDLEILSLDYPTREDIQKATQLKQPFYFNFRDIPLTEKTTTKTSLAISNLCDNFADLKLNANISQGEEFEAEKGLHNISYIVESINDEKKKVQVSSNEEIIKTLNLDVIYDTMGFGGFRVKPVQIFTDDDIDNSEDLIVKIFIDDELRDIAVYNSENGYHELKWVGPRLGVFTLKATAEDSQGNIGIAELDVWYFCFIPE